MQMDAVPVGRRPPAQELTRELLVTLLSDTLDATFCRTTVQPAVSGDGKTHPSTFMFQCKVVPTMTIKQYFQRLAKYTGVSGEAMILAMMHVARVYKTLPSFPVNILTIHRLLLTSVLVSAKYFDDSFLNNARYARVGGVTRDELNMLEVEFLFLIDFNLYVCPDDYERIYKDLVLSTPLVMQLFTPSSVPTNSSHAMRADRFLSSSHSKEAIAATPPTPTSATAAKLSALTLHASKPLQLSAELITDPTTAPPLRDDTLARSATVVPGDPSVNGGGIAVQKSGSDSSDLNRTTAGTGTGTAAAIAIVTAAATAPPSAFASFASGPANTIGGTAPGRGEAVAPAAGSGAGQMATRSRG